MMRLSDQVRATLNDQPTELLLASLLVLDTDPISDVLRQTRAWLCDFLEERHPVLTPSLEAWALVADHPLSYCRMIEAVLRREGIVKP